MMKLEYIYKGDGDVFVDYSWERALLINDEVYPEWVMEFFSTMYFDKDVDKSNLMTEKCLFTEDEVNHRLFSVHFDVGRRAGLKESMLVERNWNTNSGWNRKQNNYMLEHSMPILHHLADQGNFAYLTYEPPKALPYPYPYIPYPHSYTHYPNPGNQSYQGGSYELGGHDYYTNAMPDFGGNSSGYAVGGSSRGARFADEDMDE
nr:hypothetical protein [Tanacetum cinerariifolium]